MTSKHHAKHTAHSASPRRDKPDPSRERDSFKKFLLFLVPTALVLVGVVLVAPGSSSPSDPASGSSSPDALRELQRRVNQLERRVTALEDDSAPGPTDPTDPTDPTEEPTSEPPSPTEEPTSEPPSPTDPPTSEPTSPPTTDPTTPPTTPPTPPPAGGFPTLASAGLPSGWSPVRTVQGSYTVSTAGAVVEDLRINGDLIVNAPYVVVRNVEIVGGSIDNFRGRTCHNGLVIEDSTIRASGPTNDDGTPAVGAGGYTASNVLIDGTPEGFRVGGRNAGGCGPVTISDSYSRNVSPTSCTDWHGDGIQGYDGNALTVRNSVLVLEERRGCGGTAPFFYPDSQGNTSVDIDGLIVEGGGYPFRLGMPGRVRNLNIVEGWGYGPLDVRCSLITSWDAQIVTLDSSGQPVPVRDQSC